MVSPSDLQIWQNAVNGINESGKTDLIQEEWSALTVLNGCLSSGNFQSDESHRSIKLLKEHLSMHSINPILQTHLQNFITLCVKYGATHQSAEVVPSSSKPTPINPSIGINGIRQTNTNGQSKKSGSNSLQIIIITAIILGVGYYLVKDSDWFNNLVSTGGNTNENYDYTLSIQIPNGNQYGTYIDSVSLGGRRVVSNTVSYNNGNFTLKLKDMQEERLRPFSDMSFEGAIISDSEAQFYFDKYLSIIGTYKNNEMVGHIYSSNYGFIPLYVDRKCKISGSHFYSHNESTCTYNLLLKKGWNKVYTITIGKTSELTTTLPPRGLEWMVQLKEQYRTNEPKETINRDEQSEQEVIIEQPNKQVAIPGRFPQASEHLLTPSDLQYLSKEDLKIMRNEIFARHGYIFQTEAMKTYFQNQSWYTPRYSNVNSWLTNIEQKNIALIKRYE